MVKLYVDSSGLFSATTGGIEYKTAKPIQSAGMSEQNKQAFVDSLGKWLHEREESRSTRDKALAEFLLVKTEVAAALDAGYEIKTTWEYLRETGAVSSRYEAFRRLVHKHVTPVRKSKPQKHGGARGMSNSRSRGFHYNPNPNSDDLI